MTQVSLFSLRVVGDAPMSGELLISAERLDAWKLTVGRRQLNLPLR